MTPPDNEEAPSALSRLERALAGFGEPKPAPAAEPEPVEAEVEPESEPEPEPVPAPEPEPEPETEFEPVTAEADDADEADDDGEAPAAAASAAEEWAPPSSSVLDIAAAVAAVEQLSAQPDVVVPPPLTVDEDVLGEPASDADALVLAATAAGTAPAGDEDEVDADEEEEQPRFEPADLRARIHEFANESDEAEPEDEAADEPEAEPEAEPEDAEAEPEEREPVSLTWNRNLGDTALPYFLVENETPEPAETAEPVLPAVTATSSVEDLRETLVRPMPKAAAEPKPPASIARTLAEIPILLIVAAVIAFLVKTFLAQAYYIPSGSMLPQLQINDRVVVTKLAYKVHDPRRGDIIVFDDPRPGATNGNTDEGLLRKVGEGIGIVQPSTDEFIKRVIGLPGETVEGKNGHVYINGHRLIEPYLKSSVVTSDFAPVKVQQGKLWVMGDNRTGSADSRVFGQIRIKTIVGRAMVKVWPFNHISFL